MGEDSGELLARDERSETLEIETIYGRRVRLVAGEGYSALGSSRGILTSVSVRRLGQNSMSSSRSKERPASNLVRKVEREAVSVSSFMLRTPRNWRWEFWETDSLGARRCRPPWWLCDMGAGWAGCGL